MIVNVEKTPVYFMDRVTGMVFKPVFPPLAHAWAISVLICREVQPLVEFSGRLLLVCRYRVTSAKHCSYCGQQLAKKGKGKPNPSYLVFAGSDKVPAAPNGGLTIGVAIDVLKQTWRAAISVCSMSDVFIKQEGYNNVMARLQLGHCLRGSLFSDPMCFSYEELVRSMR